MKQLINKKGLNGVRCRAVVLTCPAMEDARATAAAIMADLRPLHSFDNAAKLHEAFGWPVVKGFLVLERPDKEAGRPTSRSVTGGMPLPTAHGST